MSRYARQTILPEFGPAGQARLKAAHATVIGAGGLAATVLPLLAGAGVGRITIVDGDTVALSNLHRQHLFTEADCGTPKADAAAARCRALNSEIAVTAHGHALTPANALALVQEADIVIDCADSYAVSYTLSDVCAHMRRPLITASALGLHGYVAGVCGGAPSLRAVFPDAPDSGASCATAGVMGPVVSLIGACQAQMALACLIGLTPSPLGQLAQFDAHTYRMSGFRFDASPEPDRAFRFVAARQLVARDTVVELRGPAEAPEPLLPQAVRIAPDALRCAVPDGSGRLALCCATGLRAWRAAETIQDIWPGEIVLVAASAS